MSTDEIPADRNAAATSRSTPPMLAIDIASANTVALRGELDLSTADHLYRTVSPLIDQSTGELTIDLSELHFCDSTGLTTFIQLDQCLQSRARQLRLTHPSESIRRILSITALDQTLTID